MKICVIGGAGFIGSNLVRRLRESKHHVCVVDINVPVGSDVVECDVRDLDQVQRLNLPQYDAVYLYAAIMRAGECMCDPVNAYNTNVTGVVNVLTCLRGADTRLIFSSTVHVYNDPLMDNVDEMTVINFNFPMHIYPNTKLVGESLIRSYADMYGVNYTILRFGIVYGPQGHMDMVLHRFVDIAKKSGTLQITGDGEVMRNFVYIDDIVNGSVSALSPEANRETVNLCSDYGVSVINIAGMIRKVLGECEIGFLPPRKGDHSEPMISNKKAKRLLNWSPTVNITEGIRKSIEWI